MNAFSSLSLTLPFKHSPYILSCSLSFFFISPPLLLLSSVHPTPFLLIFFFHFTIAFLFSISQQLSMFIVCFSYSLDSQVFNHFFVHSLLTQTGHLRFCPVVHNFTLLSLSKENFPAHFSDLPFVGILFFMFTGFSLLVDPIQEAFFAKVKIVMKILS